MPPMSPDQRLARIQDVMGCPDPITGGYRVMVANHEGDTTWIAIPAKVGEPLLRTLAHYQSRASVR